jgi:hypothetical protein
VEVLELFPARIRNYPNHLALSLNNISDFKIDRSIPNKIKAISNSEHFPNITFLPKFLEFIKFNENMLFSPWMILGILLAVFFYGLLYAAIHSPTSLTEIEAIPITQTEWILSMDIFWVSGIILFAFVIFAVTIFGRRENERIASNSYPKF